MAPNRVNVLTSITGVEFEDVWRGRVPSELDGLAASFIDKASFILNKKATGRTQDKADTEALGAE